MQEIISDRNRPACPSLYQINTRATLSDLSQRLGRSATLDDISDSELDRLVALGFDWVWFLGVWQTGPTGRRISMSKPEWQREYRLLLPDYREEDVCGSCFAIQSYTVHADFGGDEALVRLRDRLHDRGLSLLLDFVPNHTAPDHPWVRQHPEFYVHGTEEQMAREPQNYTRVDLRDGPAILAYGRDPYFAGWPDTLQLNYAEPALQQALQSELARIATLCDGVRCDMAMLVLPEVFQRTWGLRPEPFWQRAMEKVRQKFPNFLFMAEVYWDLEWELQQLGFDYTYDKRLYDRLVEGHVRPVRDHFRADLDFQRKSARFLENHDEPRAAATFGPSQHQTAAVLAFLCPGLRFIHQGQIQGRTKRLPTHLRRQPAEADDTAVQAFYERLLLCVNRPEVRNGTWSLLETSPAWEGNWTCDCFVCFAWRGENRLIVTVNYAPNQSQCRMPLPFPELEGKAICLTDLTSPQVYYRNGSELLSPGLYLDLPPWGYNVFAIEMDRQPL